MWVSAVVEIEQYRFERAVTDCRTALGPQPVEYPSAKDWYAVTETVQDAHAVLAAGRRIIQREPPSRTSVLPSIEGPTLDIGI